MKYSSKIFDITALCCVIFLPLHFIFSNGTVVSVFIVEAYRGSRGVALFIFNSGTFGVRGQLYLRATVPL